MFLLQYSYFTIVIFGASSDSFIGNNIQTVRNASEEMPTEFLLWKVLGLHSAVLMHVFRETECCSAAVSRPFLW